MFAQMRLFPERASTMADRVDALFLFLLAVTGTMSILIALLVIWFAVRYRRGARGRYDPRLKGSILVETLWTVGPLLVFLVMFFWGASVYFRLYTSPEDATDIYVVGKQWMWKIQHPDGQREINELHVPVGQRIRLRMTSEDVIHSFFVPAFRTKHDVVPGRYSTLWFEPNRVGTYHLFCAEYCGTWHSRMIGSVVVMEPAQYQTWLDSHAEGSLALEGRKIFLKYRCLSCHNTSGTPHGPPLEELYGKLVLLEGGKRVTADEDYIRESILQPKAKVVAGFRPIMPTFQGQVSEEEVLKLIAYIRSLGRGETPPRVEETPPPIQEPAAESPGGPNP